MRDLVVRESLERLAQDAGTRLRGLVDSGEELPYDVTEPGEDYPFAQFAPQTARFIRSHATALLDLESFGPACSSLAAADVSASYLERLGEPVPGDPGRRAADAVVTFLCRVWEGSADFTLDPIRIDAALTELETAEEPAEAEAEVLVPVIGLQMPTTRLELASASLVRAETIDAPQEARNTEGARRSAWEPLFFAVVRRPLAAGSTELEDGPGPALRELVTALRLFKPGGVGMGPHAWARSSGDRWRRIATGTGRPRPGAYWLTGSELGDLVDFSRAFPRINPNGPLARAIARFEAGLERPSLLDALSDYMLALRMLLEGGGVSDVGLAMRAAALRSEGPARQGIKLAIERATTLEQSIVRGEVAATGGTGSPLELVAQAESVVRGILRDAVRGRLGRDLRAAADETLLADGLAFGEGASAVRGATAEWGAVKIEPVTSEHEPVTREHAEVGAGGDLEPETETTVLEPVDSGISRLRGAVEELEEAVEEGDDDRDVGDQPAEDVNRSVEIRPNAGRRRRFEAEEDVQMPNQLQKQATQVAADDWLGELGSQDTLDWPERPAALRMLDQRPAERRAARDRVEHLFPRPETTEWSVAELDYDRRRRQRIRV